MPSGGRGPKRNFFSMFVVFSLIFFSFHLFFGLSLLLLLLLFGVNGAFPTPNWLKRKDFFSLSCLLSNFMVLSGHRFILFQLKNETFFNCSSFLLVVGEERS